MLGGTESSPCEITDIWGGVCPEWSSPSFLPTKSCYSAFMSPLPGFLSSSALTALFWRLLISCGCSDTTCPLTLLLSIFLQNTYHHPPALKLLSLFPSGHHNESQLLSSEALPDLLLDGPLARSPFTIHTFAPAAPFDNTLFLFHLDIMDPSFWTQFKCSFPWETPQQEFLPPRDLSTFL